MCPKICPLLLIGSPWGPAAERARPRKASIGARREDPRAHVERHRGDEGPDGVRCQDPRAR
eukprot:5493359-Alexandrium_andersonii.AAC.1